MVLKFGGSSLATPEMIHMRAQHIVSLKKSGEPILVVVSAMGNMTNDLVQLSYKISEQPNRRELDMLLTTGERVTMALMSMAINDLGHPAISFTGSQAGIFTDQGHTDASIKELKPIRVEEELKRGKIVVIAGFQGVDPITKEITTLGRGGSDTTAIAMAHHFKATSCRIMKDVPGVMSADPKLVKNARPLEHLSFEQLLACCRGGAKVLHRKAIELAAQLKFSFEVSYTEDATQKTVISAKACSENGLLSVNYLNHVFNLKFSQPKEFSFNDLVALLEKNSNINKPTLLNSGTNEALAFADAEVMKPFVNWCQSLKKPIEILGPQYLITATYAEAVGTKQVADLNKKFGDPAQGLQFAQYLNDPHNVSALSTDLRILEKLHG